MPHSRFALHGSATPLFTVLCAMFASSSRFMRLFQAPLNTCLGSPFFASLSIRGLHFMVYAASIKTLRGNSVVQRCRPEESDFSCPF